MYGCMDSAQIYLAEALAELSQTRTAGRKKPVLGKDELLPHVLSTRVIPSFSVPK